jgi:arabinogalactan oligomer/maltooligosaccharide transport system substrate-binding protein
MSKSWVRLLAAMLVLALLLTACAGKGQPDKSGNNADSSSTQATPLPATPQPLIIWHAYAGEEQQALDEISRQFEAANPLIDVQLTAYDDTTLLDDYIAATTAGGGPDLLLGPAEWVGILSQQGLLWSFGQDFIDEVSSNLTREVANTTMIQGAPFGAAFTVDMTSIYYNRTLVENPPKEYTELVAQASFLTLIVPPSFTATSGLYLSAGGLLMDGQGNNLVTLPALDRYLVEVQTLAAAPGVIFTDDQNRFIEGQAGFLFASSNDYRALQAALGDKLGVIKLPRIVPDMWRTLVRVECAMLSVNSTAEAAAAARPFIVALTRSSTQRDWFEQTGLTPVNPAELDDASLGEAWSGALEWVAAAPLAASFDAIMLPALDQAVIAVAVNGEDPAAVAQRTIDALQAP